MDRQSETEETAQEIWNANHSVLSRMFDDFDADILPLRGNEKRLCIQPAADGSLWGSYNGRALCSRHNPSREAQRIVSTGLSPSPGCIVVVYAGLGYRLKAIRSKYPHVPVVAVEPDVPLFLEILTHIDYSSILASGDITLLLGASPETVLTVLGNMQFIGPLEVLVHRSIADSDGGAAAALLDKLAQFSSRKEVNANTMKRFGKTWLKNLFTNLPQFACAKSLHYLYGCMGTIPALVLAAGPSLDILIPHIKELQRRCVIIAVDTAVSWCRLHGIEPDFIVVIDPQYWNTRHLDRLPWMPPLISESSTHPRVFRVHNGPRYFCSSLFPLGKFFDVKAGITGELGAGGSVSTSAWDFAHYITKGTVYIAGLDLGFPDKKTHYKGSFFEERAHLLSSRTAPASQAHFHALRDGNPFWETNNAGGKTLTDRRLIVYKWWFENQIAARKNEATISLSPGAIAIRGLPHEDLRRILEFAETREDIRSRIDKANEASQARTERNLEIDTLVAGLNNLKAIAAQGVSAAGKTLEELKKEKPSQETVEKGILRLNETDRLIQASAYKDIAGFLLQDVADDIAKSGDGLETSLLLYMHLEYSLDYQIRLLRRSLKAAAT